MVKIENTAVFLSVVFFLKIYCPNFIKYRNKRGTYSFK